MSNVIKAGTYKYIHERTPIIDTGCTAEVQRLKVLEEIEELKAELLKERVDMKKALEEYHDIRQSMAGYVLAQVRDIPIDAAVGHAIMQMKFGNARHEQKMTQRIYERGWTQL